MWLGAKRIAACAGNFLLLTAVSLGGIFALVAEGPTILPSGSMLRAPGRGGYGIGVGKEMTVSNPVRRGITTYRRLRQPRDTPYAERPRLLQVNPEPDY
jgi:hypothetical protein